MVILSVRSSYLLAFLAASPEELDPVRIMKGMFLFGQECPSDWVPDGARYRFVPYNYGPFSQEVYGDLDALRSLGYVEVIEKPGVTWRYHRVTDKGCERAASASIDPRARTYLSKLRRYVTSLSFSSLLKAVYKKYPDFAVNSVFRY